jgi:hypothetical protein
MRARVVFAVVLAVQLVLLYWPRAVQPAGGLPWDKIVHATIFGLVVVTGLRAGIPRRPWILVTLAHAVVSELVQHALLPNRSGDPYDALADVAGVVIAAIATARPKTRTETEVPGLRNPADGSRRARE